MFQVLLRKVSNDLISFHKYSYFINLNPKLWLLSRTGFIAVFDRFKGRWLLLHSFCLSIFQSNSNAHILREFADDALPFFDTGVFRVDSVSFCLAEDEWLPIGESDAHFIVDVLRGPLLSAVRRRLCTCIDKANCVHLCRGQIDTAFDNAGLVTVEVPEDAFRVNGNDTLVQEDQALLAEGTPH